MARYMFLDGDLGCVVRRGGKRLLVTASNKKTAAYFAFTYKVKPKKINDEQLHLAMEVCQVDGFEVISTVYVTGEHNWRNAHPNAWGVKDVFTGYSYGQKT